MRAPREKGNRLSVTIEILKQNLQGPTYITTWTAPAPPSHPAPGNTMAMSATRSQAHHQTFCTGIVIT